MTKGLITRSMGGFYEVEIAHGKSYNCRARGLFRKEGITPYVGDFVKIDIIDQEEAYIMEILPRKNFFVRPPVANVDCFLITLAIKKPEPNLYILDKLIVTAEYWKTEIVICLNKVDLASPSEIENLKSIYEKIYPTVSLSAASEEGMDELRQLIKGKKSAFAGPSGVGKSTLLNKIYEKAIVETGEVSERTKRGKHTTRHVELFHIDDDTLVFDTPGFTSFDLPEIEEEELTYLFPEMREFMGLCRFHNCRHENEPSCKIREAKEEGIIASSRYLSYLRQLTEIREQRRY